MYIRNLNNQCRQKFENLDMKQPTAQTAKSGNFEAATSPAASDRLEEAAGFRGSGSWIQEAATCTLLIRYIRENFKIATFSHLSGSF